MNKKHIILAGLIGTAGFFSACNKKLDLSPNNQISTSSFFKTASDAKLALNGCYAYLDGDFSLIYKDAESDNAYAQYPWESNATAVAAGNITANIDEGYASRYVGIRRFNYFLANIGTVPMDSALKKRYIAEARFLRAYTYLNMATIFGPVPLLTAQYTDPAATGIKPTPAADIFTFVLNELAAAATDLPASYGGGDGNETGRVTKGAALAMKARAELYTGKWSDAVTDAQAVMGMGYKLFRTTPSSADMNVDYSSLVSFSSSTDKQNFYKGIASYAQQFWTVNSNNSEVILSAQYAQNVNASGVTTLFLPAQFNGWSSVTPTQGLVNAYGDRNGNPVTSLPTPAQRAAYYNNGNPTSAFLNEFKNRDTRLYASVLFPGAPVYINGSYTSFSWPKGGNNTSKTGYNYLKLTDPAYLQEYNGNNDFPLIRYAEVLLTYAEAQNEVSGPVAGVFAALNDIRDRVGMPPVDQTVYNTKDKLRTLIQNERRIELAGEGQRYWDIRRWKIAGQVMHSEYDITNQIAQSRFWDDKFYLMPYPQTAIDRNANLKDAQAAKGY